jgi:hypothetical protein
MLCLFHLVPVSQNLQTRAGIELYTQDLASLNSSSRYQQFCAMGVKGLASFVKDNQQSICKTVVLEQNGDEQQCVPIVVDAWGYVDIYRTVSTTDDQYNIPAMGLVPTLDVWWRVSALLPARPSTRLCLALCRPGAHIHV